MSSKTSVPSLPCTCLRRSIFLYFSASAMANTSCFIRGPFAKPLHSTLPFADRKITRVQRLVEVTPSVTGRVAHAHPLQVDFRRRQQIEKVCGTCKVEQDFAPV